MIDNNVDEDKSRHKDEDDAEGAIVCGKRSESEVVTSDHKNKTSEARNEESSQNLLGQEVDDEEVITSDDASTDAGNDTSRNSE